MSKLLAQNPLGSGFKRTSDSYNPEVVTNDSIVESVVNIISGIIGIITVVGAIFFIVYFFIAAFQWVTSGDDSKGVETARNKMLQGVIGLVVMVLGYSFIGIIGRIVGIDLINLEDTIMNVVPES